MLNSKRLWTTTLLLGLAFDFLFWKKMPGISFAIFVALCLVGGYIVLRMDGVLPARRSLWLLAPIAFFAAMTFVRQEPLTAFLNYALTLFFMALLALSYLGGRWPAYSLSDYLAGFFRLAGSMLGRPLSFIAETRRQRKEAGADENTRRVWPVVRGLLIALPIVAIFASLLSSADLVFAQRLDDFIALFRLEKLPEYIFRGMYIFLLAYLLVGILLYAAFKSRDEKLLGEEKPVVAPFLGFTEAGIVLGSVVLLFAAFVVVQFQYFFGGQVNINIDGYTYSEYARRGFGELVTVAVFSLLLFLGLSTVARRDTAVRRKVFSGLGIGLVVLVLVMLVSAFQRLTLYETVYGFSRLRTYPHVFMVWLGILLTAVVVLEIVQRQRVFAVAALFALLGFAATLDLLNVDAFIVRQNVQLSVGGRELDSAYLASLSDDAIPALADSLEVSGISAWTRDGVAAAMICYRSNEGSRSEPLPWQSFHLARWRADRVYDALQTELSDYTLHDDDWPVTVTSPNGAEFDCWSGYFFD
ncbi:MAG: DUF4173 domain-containing protein [Chloroflexi bacterium]|nr:DUF4173 domain-containing protein [Chloroflexota bacterium]